MCLHKIKLFVTMATSNKIFPTLTLYMVVNFSADRCPHLPCYHYRVQFTEDNSQLCWVHRAVSVIPAPPLVDHCW